MFLVIIWTPDREAAESVSCQQVCAIFYPDPIFKNNFRNAQNTSRTDLYTWYSTTHILERSQHHCTLVSGNDTLAGLQVNELIIENQVNDSIVSGMGEESIEVNLCGNTIDSGDNYDKIDGCTYGDSVIGGYGNNELIGNEEYDTIDSSNGNDSVLGSSGDNQIYGIDGADTLTGNSDYDHITDGSVDYSILGDNNEYSLSGVTDTYTITDIGGSGTISVVYGNDSLGGNVIDDL